MGNVSKLYSLIIRYFKTAVSEIRRAECIQVINTTVKALSIGTDRSEQTVQTQNRLLIGAV